MWWEKDSVSWKKLWKGFIMFWVGHKWWRSLKLNSFEKHLHDDITSCRLTGGLLLLKRSESDFFRVPSQCQKYVSWPRGRMKMRLWHVREGHNCVIVPAAAAAVRIINTCGHSRERGVIPTSHKMEKTGKHIRRGEGRLLLISCLCTETCFIKTLQPAVSLIFTDRPEGHKWRKDKPFSFPSFLQPFTDCKPWSCRTLY